uniref:AT-rich interactive domain-containing protein 3 n=1 Tax=Gouania willdenowi TaxID=441366 RepID=A0A8C5E5X6_GOUWI
IQGNASYSKEQPPGFPQDRGPARCAQSSPAGLKLEAVMEQLQRQHEAKMEMSLQERHLLQAQFLFAQQAAAAQASNSIQDAAMYTNPDRQTSLANPYLSRADLQEEEEEDSDEEGLEMDLEPEENNVEEDEEEDEEEAKKLQIQQVSPLPFRSPSTAVEQTSGSRPLVVKQEHVEKNQVSPVGSNTFMSPNSFPDWGYDEQFKQRGNNIWAEESDGGKVRGEPSRDFAKLYELNNDPLRKEFLDELFVFMQNRGTPVNRIPIMAKQVLDLYKLYKLVTDKGGLVEVINKKIWREITKGLNLPTSITSAAFTLRTQYMKYLYPFECEKKGLSSPSELQAAIDSNRREGRRPSYTNSMYHYSPSPSSAANPLLSSSMQTPPVRQNGHSVSASPSVKRNADESATPVIHRLPMPRGLGQQQQLAQAATLEHLRELQGGAVDSPDKKMMRLAEEQQRLMQQALQHNFLAMASHLNPMNLKVNSRQESNYGLSLNISTNGPSTITVSIEVNGTIYSGESYFMFSGETRFTGRATSFWGSNARCWGP